jgi:hypothetical protein
MTAKNFFLCQTILNISFGLGLLLTPQMLVDMYVVQKTDVTDMFDVVVHLKGIFQGVENPMAWLVVLSTSLITVWSGLVVSRENKEVLA